MGKFNPEQAQLIDQNTTTLTVRILLALQDSPGTRKEIYEQLPTHSSISVRSALSWLERDGFITGGAFRNDPLRLTEKGVQLAELFLQIWLLTTDTL